MYFLVHFGHTTNPEKLRFNEVFKVTIFRILIFGSFLIVVLLLSLFFGASVSNSREPLKIAGGQEVVIGQCPSIVFLGCPPNNQNDTIDLEHYCGAGSIVNKNWILTAAHLCFDPGPSIVIAGLHDIDRPDANWQRRLVSEFHRHPNLSTTLSDLCLLRVDKPFDLTSQKVQAAKFNHLEIPVGTELTTFGWGRTYYESPTYSSVLRKVTQVTVSIEECQQKFGRNGRLIQEPMVCGIGPDKGPCNGDSGAPLVWQKAGNVQVAVVSWGVKCAHPYYPNVYAGIENSMDWIQSVTKVN